MDSAQNENIKQVVNDLMDLNEESLSFINKCTESLKEQSTTPQIVEISQSHYNTIYDNTQSILKHLQVENFLLSQKSQEIKNEAQDQAKKSKDKSKTNIVRKRVPKK